MHIVLQLNICKVFKNSGLSDSKATSQSWAPSRSIGRGQMEPSPSPGEAGAAVRAWPGLGMRWLAHPFPRQEAGQLLHLVPQMDRCPAPRVRGNTSPCIVLVRGPPHFHGQAAGFAISENRGALWHIRAPPKLSHLRFRLQAAGPTPGERQQPGWHRKMALSAVKYSSKTSGTGG